MPRLNEETGLKECSKCHEHKPASEFHKNKRTKRNAMDGLHSECKICSSERRRTAIHESDSTLIELLCTKCNLVKAVSLFGFDRNKLNGYSSNCRDCTNSYARNKNFEVDLTIISKMCRVCEVEKGISEFAKDKRKKDGLENSCRECLNKNANIRAKNDKYRDRANSYIKDKYKNDPLFAIKMNYSTRLRSAIRDLSLDKTKRSLEFLGCSMLEFSDYLEKLFFDGMSFEYRNKWHLDHFIPISLAESLDDIFALSHFTNFRPLWISDNIRKRDTIPALDDIYLHFKNYLDSPAYKFYLEYIKTENENETI